MKSACIALPKRSVKFIVHQLTAVGGRSQDQKTLTSSVYVYEHRASKPAWVDKSTWSDKAIPCLSMPRARACVISQTEDESSTCIAACGGRVLYQSKDIEVSTSIEVYNYKSLHWVTVDPLPHSRAAPRATILHNTAYLMGGYQDLSNYSKPDCFSIPLCSLFQKDRQMVWTTMKELPTQSATPAHLYGTLLAIGGSKGEGKPVHAYNPNRRQWIHIADLTEGLSHATAAALPDGRVVIVGGRNKMGSRNKNIFIVKITGQLL